MAAAGETMDNQPEREACRKSLDINEKDAARRDLAASGGSAPRRTRTYNPLIKSQPTDRHKPLSGQGKGRSRTLPLTFPTDRRRLPPTWPSSSTHGPTSPRPIRAGIVAMVRASQPAPQLPHSLFKTLGTLERGLSRPPESPRHRAVRLTDGGELPSAVRTGTPPPPVHDPRPVVGRSSPAARSRDRIPQPLGYWGSVLSRDGDGPPQDLLRNTTATAATARPTVPNTARVSSAVPPNGLKRRVRRKGPAGRSSPKTYQTRRARGFIRPDSTGTARHGTTTWTWHRHAPEETNRPRIRAERDDGPAAKCWRGGNRCWCYGSTGRSCYGSPSGRSPVDC